MIVKCQSVDRTGGVYIAVLGTALVISMLGLAALVAQRIQNRLLTASADIRQAQLNALTALQLGRLIMKQDEAWRTTYSDLEQPWFTRSTGAGTAQLFVSPADATEDEDENALLYADPNTPVKLLGIGSHHQAQQHVTLVVDPRPQALSVLRAATESAKTGAPLHGQATTFDWSAVFSAYQARGTQLNINSLPTRTASFARNMGFNSNTVHWTGDVPNIAGFVDNPDSNLTRVASFSDNSTPCLRVDRSDKRAGAANRLNAALLKPNTLYQVRFDINPNLGVLNIVLGTLEVNYFKVSLVVEHRDGTTEPSPDSFVRSLNGVLVGTQPWTSMSGELRTPGWTQHPANVYLVVNSDHSSGTTKTFYLDNLDVHENGARFIHQKSLGPAVDQLYAAAPTNPNGIYWMNCGGNTVVIERSRILGTLLLLNPGANSRIDYGPIHLSPFQPGYPALLVDGNFVVRGNNRPLGELENSSAEQGITTNYNPAGMPYQFGTPVVASEDGPPTMVYNIYPSEIRGLVAISGNLTYANTPRICGPVIVGGSTVNGGGTLTVENDPESLLNPPPGFAAPTTFERRPASVVKAVLP